MNYLRIITSIFVIIYTLSIRAQSKKDIRNNKISSITSITSTYENGKEVNYKDSYIAYDKNGNIIEEIEYFINGSIKSKKTYKYNSDKNKIEEIEYDSKTKNTIKIIFLYNSDGNKISEVMYDMNEKLIRKVIFVYDKNGLRIEKKTFDVNNKLISVKKYNYLKK